MMRRNNSINYLVIICIVFSLCFASGALALGHWHRGKVTRAPWKNKYTYIQIDNVQYTIMDTTLVKKWYTKGGVEFHDLSSLGKVRKGKNVRYVSEGNRIYRIEIIQ